MVAYENNVPVPTCGPDIYFDEREDDERNEVNSVREVLKLIISAQNPRLEAEVLCLITGIANKDCTEQAIASRYGLTRAAISARATRLREIIGLPRPTGPLRYDLTRLRCLVAQIKKSLE